MRILRKALVPIGRDGASLYEGMVRLLPEEPDDMYHVYHLLQVGDLVRASTMRKVVTEASSGSGAVQSHRVRLTITIEIEEISYEPTIVSSVEGGAGGSSARVRLKGRCREENPHVKLGAYHTLELELKREFTLRKSTWDQIYLDRLDDSTNLSKRAEVAAVVMQMGSALVCLVTDYMTVIVANVKTAVPKKRSGDAGTHKKGVDKFHQSVLEALLRHVDFNVVKCVVIASPGFVKDDFVKYMDEALSANSAVFDAAQLAGLRQNRSKLILAHSSSGHKQALTEVLAQPEMQHRMKDTRAAQEVRSLAKFFQLLNTGDGTRAAYGYKHVRLAQDASAVEELLVCDDFLRGAPTSQARAKYVKLLEDAKASNAQVRMFSRLHDSGAQLYDLSGIAAILRFPFHYEEEDEDEEEDAAVQEMERLKIQREAQTFGASLAEFGDEEEEEEASA